MQGWKITLRWLYVILLSKLFGYVPLTYSRITPHIYNTEADLDRFISILGTHL